MNNRHRHGPTVLHYKVHQTKSTGTYIEIFPCVQNTHCVRTLCDKGATRIHCRGKINNSRTQVLQPFDRVPVRPRVYACNKMELCFEHFTSSPMSTGGTALLGKTEGAIKPENSSFSVDLCPLRWRNFSTGATIYATSRNYPINC